jgi:hypothetical protein
VPDTRGRGILKEPRCKGKSGRAVPAASFQWHAHMAVFWHEGPPEGHSSPGSQMASLSPQVTEQPPQLPRGLEGGALQELTCPALSVLGGPPAAVLGGPVSPEAGACAPFPCVTQPASDRAMSTRTASDAPDTKRQGRMLTASY